MRIEIRDISKNYGKNCLFTSFSLTIEENKMSCLYGASGCGKTTLIDMIGLIEPYQKGEILYDNRKIVKGRDKQFMLKNKIGFIFQDFGLIPNVSVKENLNMVYKIKRMKNKDQRINEVLEKLNLNNMINRKVYELSGGEQQRIAIAKIILKDPDIILADEPTASLDEDNKKLVLGILKELAKTKTVIIVSHDWTIIDYCDVSYDLQKIKLGESL